MLIPFAYSRRVLYDYVSSGSGEMVVVEQKEGRRKNNTHKVHVQCKCREQRERSSTNHLIASLPQTQLFNPGTTKNRINI
jgi:hypothetical protein